MKDRDYYFDIKHRDSVAIVLVTMRAKNSDEAREKVEKLFGSMWVIVREIKALEKVHV